MSGKRPLWRKKHSRDTRRWLLIRPGAPKWRPMRRRVTLIGVALCAWAAFPSGAALATTSADTVRSCSGNYPLGSTALWYGDLSVRNVTCRKGKRLLRSADYRGGNVRIRNWRCSLIGYYGDGGIYRCTNGGKAIRFSAGG